LKKSLYCACGGVGEFGARKNDEVRTIKRGAGLAEAAGWKKPLVSECARSVDHDDVRVAGEREMLEAVVKNEYLDGLRREAQALRVAILTNAEENVLA
jgi:hypothetical protein